MTAMVSRPVLRHRLYTRQPVTVCDTRTTGFDPHVFLDYLRQNNYPKTAQCFAQQLPIGTTNGVLQSLIQIITNGGQNYHEDLDKIIESIRKGRQKLHLHENFSSQRKNMLALQLYLNVWYCIDNFKNCFNQGRLYRFKRFIEKKGTELSQKSQLLPYFALPYVEYPLQHSFLKRIFTPQWREQLIGTVKRSLRVDNAQNKENRAIISQETGEQEWLIIIKDLIGICQQLAKQVQTQECTSHEHILTMMSRVHEYEQVLERYGEPIIHSLAKQPKQDNKLEKSDIVQVKSSIKSAKLFTKRDSEDIPSSKEVSPKFLSLKCGLLELCEADQAKLIHAISLRLKANPHTAHNYLEQYISDDILSINRPRTLGIEQLKLLQLILAYLRGREYVSSQAWIVEQLCQNVELHHEFIEVDRIREGKQYSEASYHQELLIASLDALQKLCRQKIVVQQLLSTPALLTSIQRILDACRGRYQTNRNQQLILCCTLALLMNVSQSHQGRTAISRETALMDALFGLIEHMQINLYLQIESLAYSTCYLLLTNKKVVQYAESCGFREMLLDKMLRVNEDHHTYMVQYLIGLMDAHGQVGGEDIDRAQSQLQDNSQQNKEQGDSFNTSIILQPTKVWVENRLITISKKESDNLLHNYQTGQQQIKSFHGYQKDKYIWKQTKR